MEWLIYMARCIMMLFVTWIGIRILGKKTIAQMTGYELAGLMLLTTTAAEPLVFKIVSKASLGVLTLAIGTTLIGSLAMHRKFYGFDSRPSIVIANGKMNHNEMRRNKINLPFLLSMLRIKGYTSITEVAFAIIEPNGELSVIPKPQERTIKTKDLQLEVKHDGLALPLVIDGEIQYNNLKYSGLDQTWLNKQLKKAGAESAEELFLAELDSSGNLNVNFYEDSFSKPPMF